MRAASNSPSSASLRRRASKQRHQRADARRLQRFDDDLIGGLAGKGGDLAGDDDLEPFLGLDAHAAEHALPDHRVEAGVGILEREIDVAGRMRAAIAGDLAAHPHIAEAVLDRALEGARQLADREFGRIGAGGVRIAHRPRLCRSAAAAASRLSTPLWRGGEKMPTSPPRRRKRAMISPRCPAIAARRPALPAAGRLLARADRRRIPSRGAA